MGEIREEEEERGRRIEPERRLLQFGSAEDELFVPPRGSLAFSIQKHLPCEAPSLKIGCDIHAAQLDMGGILWLQPVHAAQGVACDSQPEQPAGPRIVVVDPVDFFLE